MLLDYIQGVVKEDDQNSALYKLWEKYGEWESEGPQMFVTEQVARQDGHLRASPGIDVPDSCTVLRLSDEDRGEYRLKVSNILIRDEYLKSLSDICHFATQRVLPPQNDTAEGPIGFYNPFLDNEEQSTTCAVTLLGHPGIGKSVWVVVALVLRILAGHPTIYHSRSNAFYIFNEDGLYSVDPTTHNFTKGYLHIWKAITPEYWCFVDCNDSVQTVPEFLSDTLAFIVQVTSPRSRCIDWVKKYTSMTCAYFMENWSLSELIMGRAWQLDQHCSEQDLEVFYSRYAPSARMAYAYANQTDRYEQIVHAEIGYLSFETLGKMLSSVEALQSGDVSHHIMLVSPQRDRTNHSITIPSRYMYNKLRDQLDIRTVEEAARLFQIFVRNKYTRASVDYILDDIRDFFCNGGEWRLTPMTKNEPGTVNTHFRSRKSVNGRLYMRLGYGGEQVTIANRRLTQGDYVTRLEHRRFILGQNIGLEDGYYQPLPGQPTFHSFIYDQGTQTATMLQMTMATYHDVKVEDVQWLISQGVETIRLVAVKPANTRLDLTVPNNLTPLITEVLELGPSVYN